MTTSKKCKEAGLKNLARLSEVTGESRQTLRNWDNNKPQLFEIVLLGAITKEKNNEKI